MARSRRGGRAPGPASLPAKAPGPDPPPSPSPAWVDALLSVLGRVVGRLSAIRTALILAALGAVLSAGWLTGPARFAHEREAARMTARAPGRLDRAWLSIDFDPARLAPPATHWHGAARARACARIGFDGGGTPASVTLCSLWFPFHDSWTPMAERELTPGVPFAWDRGADGLPRVELRLPATALGWLELHRSAEPGAAAEAGRTALTDLRRQLDYPIELIVDAWSQTPDRRAVAMAFAPGRPERALPVTSLPRASRAAAGGFILAAATFMWGLFVRQETQGWGRSLRWAVAVLPLLALPWWGERLPTVLRWLWAPSAELFVAFTENVSPIEGALSRGAPSGEPPPGEAALTWSVATSAYRETLGRFALRAPETAASGDADAALAALTGQLQGELAGWPDAPLGALLDRLAADDGAGRNRVSLAFVPAARAAFLDPRRGEAVRRAALGFLDQFLTAPHEDPRRGEPAFEGKLALWASLLDFPVDHVRNRASWVFGRVDRPAPSAPR